MFLCFSACIYFCAVCLLYLFVFCISRHLFRIVLHLGEIWKHNFYVRGKIYAFENTGITASLQVNWSFVCALNVRWNFSFDNMFPVSRTLYYYYTIREQCYCLHVFFHFKCQGHNLDQNSIEVQSSKSLHISVVCFCCETLFMQIQICSMQLISQLPSANTICFVFFFFIDYSITVFSLTTCHKNKSSVVHSLG